MLLETLAGTKPKDEAASASRVQAGAAAARAEQDYITDALTAFNRYPQHPLSFLLLLLSVGLGLSQGGGPHSVYIS